LRTQKVENATFDLASSEAGHQEESIKSLSNSNEKLTQAVYGASSSNWQFSPSIFANKMNALDEIDCQNLRGGWKSETSSMRYLQSWNDSNWLIIS
jgi:hypothetical protein